MLASLGHDAELGRPMLGCVVGKKVEAGQLGEELARLGRLQRVLKI
jgi:hypothetical protein